MVTWYTLSGLTLSLGVLRILRMSGYWLMAVQIFQVFYLRFSPENEEVSLDISAQFKRTISFQDAVLCCCAVPLLIGCVSSRGQPALWSLKSHFIKYPHKGLHGPTRRTATTDSFLCRWAGLYVSSFLLRVCHWSGYVAAYRISDSKETFCQFISKV